MKLIYNKCIIHFINRINRYGLGITLKKRITNCKSILDINFRESTDFGFIQVGANDGISFDFLYDFVLSRKSAGVVIEPIKEYFLELQKNYENSSEIIIINKAIHPTAKKIIIYKVDKKKLNKYPEWAKGIASLDKGHHVKLGIETADIITEEVQADTLMNIINESYKIEKLDFIQIDTEGFDYEILKMIDFDCIKPKMIKFESVNLNPIDYKEAMNLLKKRKYYLFKEGGDTIAIDLMKIRLL